MPSTKLAPKAQGHLSPNRVARGNVETCPSPQPDVRAVASGLHVGLVGLRLCLDIQWAVNEASRCFV
jgi:hypothetical protein